MNEKSKVIKNYKKKVDNLKKHNELYFNKDKPAIIDAEYDSLKKEIFKLEKKYNYLSTLHLTKNIVGAKLSNNTNAITIKCF